MPERVAFAIDPAPGRGIRSAAPITLHCLACGRFLPIEAATKHLETVHPGQGRTVRISTRGHR